MKKTIKKKVISGISKNIQAKIDKNKNNIYWNVLNTGYVIQVKNILKHSVKILETFIKNL